MRYIKKFNESVIDCDSLRDEAIILLSYLMDNGEVDVYVDNWIRRGIKTSDFKVVISSTDFILWGEYKHDIMQYIQYIDGKYDISEINFTSINDSFTIGDLSKLDDDFKFWEMEFTIKS